MSAVPQPQDWLAKTGRQQTVVTAAMQRGTDLEPLARIAYEELTGMLMQPLVLEAGAYSASLDGMTLDGDLLLEIKCPYKGKDSSLWKEVVAGSVPEHYLIQVQHQLMVSGAQTAQLWVFDGQKGLIHNIERDNGCMERICTAWDEFQGFLDNDSPPALNSNDTAVQSDKAWAQAALTYIELKGSAEAISEELETARQALVALAQHPKENGAGVTVTRFWKQGNVDYKKVPALADLDLDPYRGKARQEIRVTVGA